MTATGISLMHAGSNRTAFGPGIDHTARRAPAARVAPPTYIAQAQPPRLATQPPTMYKTYDAGEGRPYGNMVRASLIRQVRTVQQNRQRRLASVQTADDARAYAARCRGGVEAAFRTALSRWSPNAAASLEPRCTRILERDGYRVENIMYTSAPGVVVTANLYLPTHASAEAPVPAILHPLGHSGTAKAAGGYQAASQQFVRAGFAVLTYDPINQGERDQYTTILADDDQELGPWSAGHARTSTRAHNMLGKQCELVGDFFGSWMVLDGMRGVDYLETRPEVDTSVALGLSGCSGGGTNSAWLWSLDPRFTMAAPNCFVTTWLHNLENELPADCEQQPPGVVGAGLEIADLLAATNLGRPLLLTGEQYDYFDRRGLAEAHRDLSHLYAALASDSSGDWSVAERLPPPFLGGHTHGWNEDVVHAVCCFFCTHAGLPPPPSREQMAARCNLEGTPSGGGQRHAPALWATPKGDVLRSVQSAGSSTVVAGLCPKPLWELLQSSVISSPVSGGDGYHQVPGQLLELLGLTDWRLSETTPPHYRILKSRKFLDGSLGRYAIQTGGDDAGGDIEVETLLYKPLQPSVLAPKSLADEGPPPPTLRSVSLDVDEDELVVYLPHHDARSELLAFSSLDTTTARLPSASIISAAVLGNSRHTAGVYAVDVRGKGASRPDGDEVGSPYSMDFQMHAFYSLLGKPYIGRRVLDVLQTLKLLRCESSSLNPSHSRASRWPHCHPAPIRIVGHGTGALLALLAVAVDDADESWPLISKVRRVSNLCGPF
jgi:hypothetical protein